MCVLSLLIPCLNRVSLNNMSRSVYFRPPKFAAPTASGEAPFSVKPSGANTLFMDTRSRLQGVTASARYLPHELNSR